MKLPLSSKSSAIVVSSDGQIKSKISNEDKLALVSHQGVALSLDVAANRSPRPGHKRLNLSSSSSRSHSLSLPSLKAVSSKKKKLSTWFAWPVLPRSRQNSMDDTSLASADESVADMNISQLSISSSASATGHKLSLQDMPSDVLTLMLAFAGPQAASRLTQTSRHFRTELGRDDSSLWNVLGQSYGKVCTNCRLLMIVSAP